MKTFKSLMHESSRNIHSMLISNKRKSPRPNPTPKDRFNTAVNFKYFKLHSKLHLPKNLKLLFKLKHWCLILPLENYKLSNVAVNLWPSLSLHYNIIINLRRLCLKNISQTVLRTTHKKNTKVPWETFCFEKP